MACVRGTRTPYFVFTHGMLDPWFKRRYPLKHVKKWLYWPWADYRVLRDAKAVVFTCEEERLLARRSFWLYQANEVVTAYGTEGPPAGTEGAAESFLGEYPNLRGKRLVLFLSRIHEKKGCDLLLAAFAQVAAEPAPSSCHGRSGPSGMGEDPEESGRALGHCSGDHMDRHAQGDPKWGAFRAADVFCLPSHQENFGIVVAEALACGKPALISNKVNIWREIETHGAGFVDTDTVEGTARSLRRWLAMDAEEYAESCRRARHCFLECFHIDHAAQRLVEVIGGDSDS